MPHHFRNLLMLQGDNELIDHQLVYLIAQIPGDWLTITSNSILFKNIAYPLSPKGAKQLLGSEFKHAIFDARQEFNLDALTILVGTLIAGSILILVLPNDTSCWRDQDSLRWSEQSVALLVPNFMVHVSRVIAQQKRQYPNNTFALRLDEQHDKNELFHFIVQHKLITNHDDVPSHNIEQQTLLQHLLSSQDDIIILTAKRGRGKSALAGMFACYNDCWITAPNQKAVTTLMKFAPSVVNFYAPDDLIKQLQQADRRPDWLIIDEAAMIPLPMLATLINQSYRVLLTSTVEGYEGTGQGLLLKLFQHIIKNKKIKYCTLNTPIRWCNHDPLAYFIDHLIVAQTPSDCNNCINSINDNFTIIKLTQAQLADNHHLLNDVFGLLKSAHYQTTLIDFRRLLDANNIGLYSAQVGKQLVGVLVVIKEGRLTDRLIDDILKGYRRPRGNLVAQSLVAHAGEQQAAGLSSLRVNRIAVQGIMRQQGIATRLISQLIKDAKVEQYDFISVSFAYSSAIVHFWLTLGFKLVHVGTHREANSGSYSVMALYPLSDAGNQLCYRLDKKLARNWYWLKRYINIDLPIDIDHNQCLTHADKVELSLFATTSYSYSASLAVLSRLAYYISENSRVGLRQHATLLLALMANHFIIENSIVQQYQLVGKKALLVLLRQEVQQLINHLGIAS